MIGYESIQATHILGFFCQNMTSTSRDFSAKLWFSTKKVHRKRSIFCLNDEKKLFVRDKYRKFSKKLDLMDRDFLKIK